MSPFRAVSVAAAVILLALALCRRGANGAADAAVAAGASSPGPCLTCAQRAAVHSAPEVGGPDTAEALASLGYEVSEAGATIAAAPDDADAAWTRPIAVGRVRRLPVAHLDAARAHAADGHRVAVTPRSTASTPAVDASLPTTAVVPTGSSVAAAERVVRDGVILVAAGSLTGTPIHRGADGKVRVTNISSGDYSVMFLDPVRVDGLLIPAMTELPVVGQLEIDLERDTEIAIVPHASAWPSTPAPTGDG